MFRKTKLKTRMILTLGFVSAAQTILIGVFAGYYLSDSLFDEIGQRALMVSKTVAAAPSVIEGVRERDIEGLKPAGKSTNPHQRSFVHRHW